MIGVLSLAFSQATTESPPRSVSALDRILSGSFARNGHHAYDVSEFTLVCWNIERGVRRSEILQSFNGPLVADLYVLQEVDLHTRRTGYRDVAADLARGTGMNYVYGAEFEELAQGRKDLPAFHGQAVLSRYPISRARILRFRHQPYNWGPWWKRPRWAVLQPRNGGRISLVAEIQLGAQTVVVYNTHLESQTDDSGRAQQMDEILEDLRMRYSSDTPVVVAGDLNTKKGTDSVVLQKLRSAGFRDVFDEHKGPLNTKVGLERRKDWIFLRGLRPSDARVSNLPISDHYPLSVCVSISSAAKTCALPVHSLASH